MKLSREEQAARRASFGQMGLVDKIDYIYTYFKLPIFVIVAVVSMVGYTAYRRITDKDAVLYATYANVSIGEDLDGRLDGEFVSYLDKDPRKEEVYVYRGVYLSEDPSTENHQYQYASKLKIMAAIDGKQLDVVLMNREAYDIFSRNGYLLELPELLSQDSELYRSLEPHLITNTVVLEDNAIEYALNETHRYQETTEDVVNGLEVTQFPMFQQAGFPEPVYVGVVANSPRLPTVLEYLSYISGTQ